jgi:hypothetical protein
VKSCPLEVVGGYTMSVGPAIAVAEATSRTRMVNSVLINPVSSWLETFTSLSSRVTGNPRT